MCNSFVKNILSKNFSIRTFVSIFCCKCFKDTLIGSDPSLVLIKTVDYIHFMRLSDITVVINITKDMTAVMIEAVRKLPTKKLIPYH